jgi:hypothetical protein
VASIIEKYYDLNHDIWGEPQNYKGILFYPLMINQRKEYEDFFTLFTFYKEQIHDISIAKMSYLKFLNCILPHIFNCNIREILKDFLKKVTHIDSIEIFDSQSKEDKQAISDFIALLSNKKIDENELHYEFYSAEQLKKLRFYIKINDVQFNEQDFEIIREIILKQHGLDLDYISQYDPTLEENLRILHKGDDITFEECVFAISAIMKTPVCEIKNKFTIYQFNKIIERLHIIEDYESFKGLESAGFIKLKKGEISHWLSHVPKKRRYDGLLVPKETFVKENDIFKASLSK